MLLEMHQKLIENLGNRLGTSSIIIWNLMGDMMKPSGIQYRMLALVGVSFLEMPCDNFSSDTRWVSWYHEGKKIQIVDFYTM
jgi:rRNA pseudouridine-1189 N-methylase Emg1 (Nep1/Mra1 family)